MRLGGEGKREPVPGQVVTWDAQLTLLGRNTSGIYEDLITLQWGFTLQYQNGVPTSVHTTIAPVTPSDFQCKLIEQAKNK